MSFSQWHYLSLNTFRSEQNGRHFAGKCFRCIFPLNKSIVFWFKYHCHEGLNDNKASLIRVRASRHSPGADVVLWTELNHDSRIASLLRSHWNKMKYHVAIWELVETVIIPIITYGSESWEPKKKEMTQIEAIFNKTLKTILQLPDQTPTATLLAETGFIPIELVVKNKKIMHANRVLTKEKMGLIQLITKDKSLWREGIKNLHEEYNISDETLTGNKETLRKIMYYENKSKFEQYVKKEAEQKSNVKHWLEMRGGEIPQRRAVYIKMMTRKQCSNIIKVRTRMLPVIKLWR